MEMEDILKNQKRKYIQVDSENLGTSDSYSNSCFFFCKVYVQESSLKNTKILEIVFFSTSVRHVDSNKPQLFLC